MNDVILGYCKTGAKAADCDCLVIFSRTFGILEHVHHKMMHETANGC